MGCGCRKASGGGGASATLRTALAAPEWDQVARQANRPMLHRSGAFGRGAYHASGEADAVRVIEVAPPTLFPVIVDFGCGDGRVTRHLASLYRTVVAVDASRAMLRAAEAQVGGRPPKLLYVRDDGARLHRRIPGGLAVDAIVALGVLDHLPQSHGRQVLQGLAKTLRPGGRLIVTIPVGDRAVDAQQWSDTTTWTQDQVDGALAKAGLDHLGATTDGTNGGAWHVLGNGDRAEVRA